MCHDLYFSKKVNDRWSRPQNMGAPINTGQWESQPSVSAMGNELYFVRSGARGQVVKTVAETATDQPTLFIQLLSANSFSDGETITTDETTSISANTTSNTGISGVENAVTF